MPATDVYTALAEAVRAAGNIDEIGVCSGRGRTAVVFSGVNVLNKYFDGTKFVEIQFNITGADEITEQQALVHKLCGICEDLKGAVLDVAGFMRAKVLVNSLPVPVMHDQQTWIYSARIAVRGFMKGMI